MLQPGDMLGRYRIEGPLGEGGMASALLARHTASGDRVVLKVPHVSSPDVAERVRDEARAGIRLSHPHIVETLDLVEHEGRPVLVVRYVEGCALKDWWKVGPAPPVAVAHVGTQLLDALAAIHGATDEHGMPLGLLHRDVAPGNVLVDRDGNAMLIDLGIARSIESKARRTEVGIIKGTLRYLAPEVLEGQPHSVQTDLWALGVCLWEAALGRRAVAGGDSAILTAVVKGTLLTLKPGEAVDPALDDVIRTLLGKPGERFTNARGAGQALAAVRQRLGGEDAGAEHSRAWVARCPQSNNVGEKPGAEDESATRVDAAIASTAPALAPPAPAHGSGTAPTVKIAAVDEALLRAGAARTATPRAVTFAQLPTTDPGLSGAGPTPAATLMVPPVPVAQPAPTVVVPATRWVTPEASVPAPSAPAARPWLPVALGAVLALVLGGIALWVLLRP